MLTVWVFTNHHFSNRFWPVINPGTKRQIYEPENQVLCLSRSGMSDYLQPIVEEFDPMDHVTPSEEEMDSALPDNPDQEDILKVDQSLRTQREQGGAILTAKILAELHYLSRQVRDQIEIIEHSPVVEWDRDQKDDVHLFFAFVGQVQEYLLRDAVITHVISDSATTDEMKEKIMSDKHGRAMTAHECLDFLHRGGFIDSGLKGEIGQVRTERNEVTHDITRWLFAQFDPEELETQVTRGERSVVRLLELCYDFDLE